MINIINVINALKLKVKESFNLIETQPSMLEQDIANKLSDIFVDLVFNCEIKQDNCLALKSMEQSDLNDDIIEQSSQRASQSNTASQNSISTSTSAFTCTDYLTIAEEEFSLDYIQKVVKYCEEHPNYSFNTIQQRFRRLSHRNYISRFKSYINSLGTRNSKLQEIKEFVFSKFLEARNMRLPIHDIDLQRWAIQKANQLNYDDFSASQFWLHHFKFDYNIVSRKVTKLITKITEDIDIVQTSNTFI